MSLSQAALLSTGFQTVLPLDFFGLSFMSVVEIKFKLCLFPIVVWPRFLSLGKSRECKSLRALMYKKNWEGEQLKNSNLQSGT